MKGEIYSAIKVAKLPPAPRITTPPITPAAKSTTASTPSTSTGTFAAAVTNPAVKPNLALKPKELTPENTPLEFRALAGKFRSFFSTSNFRYAEIEDQQAYFLDCLDPVLRHTLERKICLLYTSPSPRDKRQSRMPSSA